MLIRSYIRIQATLLRIAAPANFPTSPSALYRVFDTFPTLFLESGPHLQPHHNGGAALNVLTLIYLIHLLLSSLCSQSATCSLLFRVFYLLAVFNRVRCLISRRILPCTTLAVSTAFSAFSLPCFSLILRRFLRSSPSNFLYPGPVCAILRRGRPRLSDPPRKTLPTSSSACPSFAHSPDTPTPTGASSVSGAIPSWPRAPPT